MKTAITQLSDKQINACTKCGGPGEFGYKIKGEIQWFCNKHRLSQNYADARTPLPEQKAATATITAEHRLAEHAEAIRAAINIHPAADAFPLMAPDELKQLTDDIAAHGLIHPIVRNAVGVILDGRNRLKACEIAGIEPRFEEFKGDDATAFIVSMNLTRRHLSESQRAMVAAKLAELSKHGGDRRSEQAAANLQLEMKQSVAAVMMSISERSLGYAAAVRKHGSAELVRQVEDGKISVSAAAKQAQPPKPKPSPKPTSKPQRDKPDPAPPPAGQSSTSYSTGSKTPSCK